MAISDEQFRVRAIAAGIVLAVGITVLRFCGDMSLPAKPDAVNEPSIAIVDDVSSSPLIYQDYLAKDAAEVGVPAPTLAEMSRAFAHRVDADRHVLEIGAAPIEVAGLELSIAREGRTLVLDAVNTTGSDLAYLVATTPVPNLAACTTVRPVYFDAMVIAAGQRERRVECTWKTGMAIAVTRVETIEVPPLSAWYLRQLDPSVVGIERRIARGHRRPKTKERCSDLVAREVQFGLENGEIGWRDLVDFYSRHRCQTYTFPSKYRALDADGQRPIPAPGAGM